MKIVWTQHIMKCILFLDGHVLFHVLGLGTGMAVDQYSAHGWYLLNFTQRSCLWLLSTKKVPKSYFCLGTSLAPIAIALLTVVSSNGIVPIGSPDALVPIFQQSECVYWVCSEGWMCCANTAGYITDIKQTQQFKTTAKWMTLISYVCQTRNNKHSTSCTSVSECRTHNWCLYQRRTPWRDRSLS